MTAPVFIRSVYSTRWCRLTVVGAEHHGTACISGAILVDDPIMLSSGPPDDEICGACKRDLVAKKARVPTVDLRPRVWTGEVADLEVDLAIDVERPTVARTQTGEW